MTQGINDKVLGSRFWVANDFQPLQQNDNASNVANAQLIQHRPAIKVKHDSTAFSFATNGEDAMVKSAINKAEIFAASHTLSEEERNQETAKANNNKQRKNVIRKRPRRITTSSIFWGMMMPSNSFWMMSTRFTPTNSERTARISARLR